MGGAIVGGVAGAVAGGAIGNSVDHERGTIYGQENRPRYRTMPQPPAEPPPPPTRDLVTAPPTPNAVWVHGYWSWDGRGYTWVAGHWEVPPPTAKTYVAAHWEFRDNQYIFVQPYWQ